MTGLIKKYLSSPAKSLSILQFVKVPCFKTVLIKPPKCFRISLRVRHTTDRYVSLGLLKRYLVLGRISRQRSKVHFSGS